MNRPHCYNLTVTARSRAFRALAMVALLVFVALSASDTFSCPDGCNSSHACAHELNSSACVFCSGTVTTGPRVLPLVNLMRCEFTAVAAIERHHSLTVIPAVPPPRVAALS